MLQEQLTALNELRIACAEHTLIIVRPSRRLPTLFNSLEANLRTALEVDHALHVRILSSVSPAISSILYQLVGKSDLHISEKHPDVPSSSDTHQPRKASSLAYYPHTADLESAHCIFP